jgi:hypothetical protein
MPRKLYKRELTTDKSTELSIPDDDTLCFAIAFPHEFLIQRVLFQQVTGTDRTGKFNIYDAPPCTLADVGGESVSFIADPNPAIHKVIPEQSYSGGTVTELFATDAGGAGWPFANREGSFTVPVKRLFLEITTTGGGGDAATFDLVIAGEPAVGL